MKLSEALTLFQSDKMVREFAQAVNIMNKSSGDEHTYWLGKCVGMADAVAVLCYVDWITAHTMLENAANHMRKADAS